MENVEIIVSVMSGLVSARALKTTVYNGKMFSIKWVSTVLKQNSMASVIQVGGRGLGVLAIDDSSEGKQSF